MANCTSPWTPSRSAAVDALEGFLPRVPAYAQERNFDRAGHAEVSRLSPYLRCRLISEEEVVTRVLGEHSFERAEKFVQEVAWRTYWKGWLDRNAAVWHSFVMRAAALEQESGIAPWGAQYNAALRGETALSCFNDWVNELTSTGYLHNHARMWFASIWIFTLKLPWQLGALFMYRNLLDGDPASNTLSWRWVAGLQTRGKSYLARADNIEKYSEGRWRPKDNELAGEAFPVPDDAIPRPEPNALPPLPSCPPDAQGVGLLMTPDDLSIDLEYRASLSLSHVALVTPRNLLGEAEHVTAFRAEACSDSAQRLEASLGRPVARISSPGGLAEWAHCNSLRGVAFAQPPTGPQHIARDDLSALKLPLYRVERGWDAWLMPYASRGFFPFWESAGKLIQRHSGYPVA